MAKRRIIQFNQDGSSEEIIKDKIQTVRVDAKAVYKRYKKAYYTLKSKGGHRHVRREEI